MRSANVIRSTGGLRRRPGFGAACGSTVRRLASLGALISVAASCQAILGLKEGEPLAGSGGSSTGSSTASSTGMGGSGGATGSPVAEFATDPVDFGLVDCGGQAPADRSISITNKGGKPLNVTASLGSTTAFSIADGGSGPIAPGETAAIVVSAASIPSSSLPGAVVSATLTLKTDDPAHPSTDILVKITPQGATLSLTPTSASFGQLPVGIPAGNVPLTLTNSGNAAVTVTFGDASDPQFGVVYQGSPTPVVLLPNTAVPGLAATFTPTSILPSVSTTSIMPTGAICGVSVSSVPMSGQGTNGGFGVSTTDVYFGPNGDGNVDCGAKAVAKTFTLTNAGNKVYSWNASLALAPSSPFSVSPTSGTVLPNQKVVVMVTPLTAIPAQSSTAPDLYGDTLVISTDITNDSPHPVTLHQTAHGAILTLGPSDVDFGAIPVNTSTNAPFTLANLGNAPATGTLSSSNPVFTSSPAGATVIGAGGSIAGTATFAPGSSIIKQIGTLSVAAGATDVLCAPLPTPINLSGTGLNGSVSFSPAAIDFHQVDCGTTAPQQPITFHNNGNQAYSITPSLGQGAKSAYVISMSPVNGLVAANGGTCVITVTPKQIPATSAVTPNLYGDLVTVTTDVIGDAPHYIPLSETARGAIVAYSTKSVPFGGVIGGGGKFSLGVTNSGNANFDGAFVNVVAPFQAPSISVGASQAQRIPLGFAPTTTGSFNDNISVVPHVGQALCQPLPSGSIALSGTMKASGISAAPPEIDFGMIPCGSTGSAKTAAVYGPAGGSVNVSASFAKGASSPFTLAPAPGTIVAVPASSKAVFTISPQAIPGTASTLLEGFDDVLTFTNLTNPSDAPAKVFLHMTATGAILNVSPTAVAFPSIVVGQSTTVNGSFFVYNTGNAPIGGVGFSLSNTTDFSLPAASVGVSPVSPVQRIATFSPATSGLKGSTLTLTTAASAPLCAPLPTGIQLSGTGN